MHAKFAVSLPADAFGSLERVRKRLRLSRSAAVARALESWIGGIELSEDDQRYVEAYLEKPEPTAESAATATAAVSTWSRWK